MLNTFAANTFSLNSQQENNTPTGNPLIAAAEISVEGFGIRHIRPIRPILPGQEHRQRALVHEPYLGRRGNISLPRRQIPTRTFSHFFDEFGIVEQQTGQREQHRQPMQEILSPQSRGSVLARRSVPLTVRHEREAQQRWELLRERADVQVQRNIRHSGTTLAHDLVNAEEERRPAGRSYNFRIPSIQEGAEERETETQYDESLGRETQRSREILRGQEEEILRLQQEPWSREEEMRLRDLLRGHEEERRKLEALLLTQRTRPRQGPPAPMAAFSWPEYRLVPEGVRNSVPRDGRFGSAREEELNAMWARARTREAASRVERESLEQLNVRQEHDAVSPDVRRTEGRGISPRLREHIQRSDRDREEEFNATMQAWVQETQNRIRRPIREDIFLWEGQEMQGREEGYRGQEQERHRWETRQRLAVEEERQKQIAREETRVYFQLLEPYFERLEQWCLNLLRQQLRGLVTFTINRDDTIEMLKGDLFSRDKTKISRACSELKAYMRGLSRSSVDSTEPFWRIPELKAFAEHLHKEGMKEERALWEDVFWMHAGAGVAEVVETLDQYQEEYVEIRTGIPDVLAVGW